MNTAYARLGVFGVYGLGVQVIWLFRLFRFQVFGFRHLGLRVNDFLEGQKGDQGGGPNMAKLQYVVKPDIFKRAAQKWPKFWVG